MVVTRLMIANQKAWFIKLWVIAAIASSGSLFLMDRKFAGSFSLGCAIMILNFYGLFKLLHQIFHSDMTRAMIFTCFLVLKFLILAVVVYALHHFFQINLMAFAIGFFIIAISATCVTGSMQNQSSK